MQQIYAVNIFENLIFSTFRPIKLEEAENLPKGLSKIFLAYQEGYLLDLSCNNIYSAICPFVTP